MTQILRASVLAFALSTACGRGADTRDSRSTESRQRADVEWFTDVAGSSGLDFVHFNGMSGRMYYPEIMAPGVAVLDYDGDGDLDIYAVQGAMLGGKPLDAATFPPAGPLGDRLFRNDLSVDASGRRVLRFTDVTERSGIRVMSYGMGASVGDFDNDGWPDIYRTGLSGSVMLRNNGDGTFSDVTARSGTANRGGWGVSSSFVDYDRDGWLDLFVGNYLIYSTDADARCLGRSGRSDYCPPDKYRAQPSRLYRNRGNGIFEDVTGKTLIGGAYGPALGVSTADFNGDGWQDIYVGNDGQPNQMWMNRRNGTFAEMGFQSGTAVSGAGNAEASMGIDAGDFDNDGDEDLFVTNWLEQMNVFYVNEGAATFFDRRAASGLGPRSLAKTGFGTGWFDFDNDGWLDLLVTNGGVATIEAQARAGDPFPLRMTDQVYRNLGDGRFEDVSSRAGTVFTDAGVGRGAAFGDIDNDGDVDVVLSRTAGRLRLLLNNTGHSNNWIGLRLLSDAGTKRERDALGARVEVIRHTAPTLWRRARSDGSYASASDPRIVVGLGSSRERPRVRVRWPSGRMEEWADLPIGRYSTLREGSAP